MVIFKRKNGTTIAERNKDKDMSPWAKKVQNKIQGWTEKAELMQGNYKFRLDMLNVLRKKRR